MQLWIVRHAVAEELSDEFPSEFDRPLTPKGRKKFRRLAEALVESGHQPAAIFTSPLVRASQTAEILREAAGLKRSAVLEEPLLSPRFNLESLVAALGSRSLPEVAALVGHEPDLSEALSRLVGGGKFEVAKGSVACVEFTGELAIGAGTLLWLARPSLV